MLHPDSRDPGVLQPGPAWSLGERRSWPALGAAPVCPPACWPPPAPARAVPAPARAVPATAGSALPVGGGGGAAAWWPPCPARRAHRLPMAVGSGAGRER